MGNRGWHSRDPDRVTRAYTEYSVWRNRGEFIVGLNRVSRRLRLSDRGNPIQLRHGF